MREDAGRKCWMIIMGIPQKEESSVFLHCFYDRFALVSADDFHRICGRFPITSLISYQHSSESRFTAKQKKQPRKPGLSKRGVIYINYSQPLSETRLFFPLPFLPGGKIQHQFYRRYLFVNRGICEAHLNF